MKILSPFDSIDEVVPLLNAGADELYGGVIPDGWRSGAVAVNRRSFADAQFGSEAEFGAAVGLAAERGAPVDLTLNAPFYHPSLYPELLDFTARALDWGIRSIIASDPGLLARVRERFPEALLTLSTMAGAVNREAFAFYRRFDVGRAVLPRHLTLAEMASIVSSAPDLEFEAFVLIGKCPNEEAYCTFQHVSREKRWPCEIPYRVYEGDSAVEASGETPQVAAKRRWMGVDRRMACGLCGVGSLRAMGVKVLKLVGRGGPTPGKVANVRLVRRYADSGGVDVDAREGYAERFGRPCVREICYFPELFRSK